MEGRGKGAKWGNVKVKVPAALRELNAARKKRAWLGAGVADLSLTHTRAWGLNSSSPGVFISTAKSCGPTSYVTRLL